MEPSCCRTPKILWDSAWTWRCLACNTAGAHETAIIGDPWGRARRPQVRNGHAADVSTEELQWYLQVPGLDGLKQRMLEQRPAVGVP